MNGEAIKRVALDTIPSRDEVIQEVLGKFKLRTGEGFGSALVRMEQEIYRRYLDYENKAWKRLSELWIEATYPGSSSLIGKIEELKRLIDRNPKGAAEFLAQNYADFSRVAQEFEKSLSQKRFSWAGYTFEDIVLRLLTLWGIPVESARGGKKKEKLKALGVPGLQRIDLVAPSVDEAIRRPDKAVFISCKRTLRERWKQVVSETTPNFKVYLVTIDPELSLEKALDIQNLHLFVFVPQNVIERVLKEAKETGRAEKVVLWALKSLDDLPEEIRRSIT